MGMQTQYEVAEQRRAHLYYGLIGFGAGALVGTTMAILFAPASGEETRAAIKGKWDDVSDKAGEAYDEAKDAVSSACEKASTAIGRAKDRLYGKKDGEDKD